MNRGKSIAQEAHNLLLPPETLEQILACPGLNWKTTAFITGYLAKCIQQLFLYFMVDKVETCSICWQSRNWQPSNGLSFSISVPPEFHHEQLQQSSTCCSTSGMYMPLCSILASRGHSHSWAIAGERIWRYSTLPDIQSWFIGLS